MLIPVMVFLFIFHIVPCFGITIAFEKFIPAKGILGSKWVGLKYFRQMFGMSNSWRIFRNTLIIACWKIVMNMIVPIVFSIRSHVRSYGLRQQRAHRVRHGGAGRRQFPAKDGAV